METKLEQAIKFALVVHEGRLDKGGHADILHAFRVMLNVVDALKIPAVLHDVVEDGARVINTQWGSHSMVMLNYEDAFLWIGSEDARILDALTRRKNELYSEYIVRVRDNTSALMIKVADLEDHLHKDRILDITSTLVDRYTKSLRILNA